MRFPIDVAFFGERKHVIVAKTTSSQPFFLYYILKQKSALELLAGTLDETETVAGGGIRIA